MIKSKRKIIDDLAPPGSMTEAERLALKEVYTQVTDEYDFGDTTTNTNPESYMRDIAKARAIFQKVRREDPMFEEAIRVNPQGNQGAIYYMKVHGVSADG